VIFMTLGLLMVSHDPVYATNAPDGHTCAVVENVPDGFLAVRNGPAARYAEVGRLEPGAFVDVDACRAGACSSSWRQIEHIDWKSDRDGRSPLKGWVNSKYLNRVDCGDEP